MLGPREASEVCDVLSMHGYPIYARWADGPTDEHLLRSLPLSRAGSAGGCDVLFAEFGLPTYRQGDPTGEAVRSRSSSLSRSGLRRPTPSERLRVAAGRLRRRDALVLHRLRLGHLATPAARPRRPRALVWAMARRRLAQAFRRRRRGVRPAHVDSPAPTNSRGTISNPTVLSSTRGGAPTSLWALSHAGAGRSGGLRSRIRRGHTPRARAQEGGSSHRDPNVADRTN